MRYINRINDPTFTYGQLNFLYAIRTVWRDLATWTSAYLSSKHCNFGDAEAVFNRLYQIPQDIGYIMQYIFGYQNAQRYVQLLSQQVVLMRQLIDAEINNDQNLANQAIQQIYSIAEQRIDFMTSINPFWNPTDWRNLIYTYLQLTIEQIPSYLTNDFETGIGIFDRLLHQTDVMGDYFAQGMYSYITYGMPLSGQQRQGYIRERISAIL